MLFSALKQQWFVVCLLVVMAWAWLWPPTGMEAAWVQQLKYGAIMAIFLCSGMALRTGELGRAALAWRLHLSIQGLSFLIAPLFGLLAAAVVMAIHDAPALATGMVVCAALPTTIAFCVAMCRGAGANDGAAVINATLGNVLGVLLTPLWLIFASPQGGQLPLLATLASLLPLVIVPLLLGQLLRLGRPLLPPTLQRRQAWLSIAPLLLVLLILFISLAQASRSGGMPALPLLLSALVFALALHGFLLACAWWLGQRRLLGLQPRERATLVICASQKTLAFGIPLVALCFPGSPDLALLMLPIIVYHPLQLLVAAALLPWWRRWLQHHAGPTVATAPTAE